MKKVNTTKEVKVTIKKNTKLTISEINALTTMILNEADKKIKEYNNNFENSLEYKTDIKALKTKYGILKAERAMIAMQLKHPKVKLLVGYSQEYTNEVKELDKKYLKKNVYTYNSSTDFSTIKNRLIVSQIEGNSSLMQIADQIKAELIG